MCLTIIKGVIYINFEKNLPIKIKNSQPDYNLLCILYYGGNEHIDDYIIVLS